MTLYKMATMIIKLKSKLAHHDIIIYYHHHVQLRFFNFQTSIYPDHRLYIIYALTLLLLELAFLPCMLLFLALPWEIVVVFSALHERDE